MTELVKINSDYLIDRYNKSLFKISKLKTNLKEFSIDSYGYSVEIAEELGSDYMSGSDIQINFIIVSYNQIFSESSRKYRFSFFDESYQDFVSDNRINIQKITSVDTLHGSIETNIFDFNMAHDVKKVYFSIDTGNNTIEKKERYDLSMNKLNNDSEFMFDNDFLLKLITLSDFNIDIDSKTLSPYKTGCKIETYFSDINNGVYVINNSNNTSTVYHKNSKAYLSGDGFIHIDDSGVLYKDLCRKNLIRVLSNDEVEQRVNKYMTNSSPSEEEIDKKKKNNIQKIKNYFDLKINKDYELSDDSYFNFIKNFAGNEDWSKNYDIEFFFVECNSEDIRISEKVNLLIHDKITNYLES